MEIIAVGIGVILAVIFLAMLVILFISMTANLIKDIRSILKGEEPPHNGWQV
jgi:hypothetical protein